jgi:recombination protein RecT
MNAAVLGLPVDSNLSYSAIIPFGKKAEFQIMTKGYTQLAIDTGLYRNIHVIEVYEDELEFYDPIHNKAYFTDKSNWKQRDNNEKNKIVGYYAFIELINGFYKEDYLTKENALAHGKKYSKSFNRSDSI